MAPAVAVRLTAEELGALGLEGLSWLTGELQDAAKVAGARSLLARGLAREGDTGVDLVEDLELVREAIGASTWIMDLAVVTASEVAVARFLVGPEVVVSVTPVLAGVQDLRASDASTLRDVLASALGLDLSDAPADSGPDVVGPDAVKALAGDGGRVVSAVVGRSEDEYQTEVRSLLAAGEVWLMNPDAAQPTLVPSSATGLIAGLIEAGTPPAEGGVQPHPNRRDWAQARSPS